MGMLMMENRSWMTNGDGGWKWGYRAQAGGVVMGRRRRCSYCTGEKSLMGADPGRVHT